MDPDSLSIKAIGKGIPFGAKALFGGMILSIMSILKANQSSDSI